MFGSPEDCVDLAEDQDVILHEYTHALHDALMIGHPWSSGNYDEALVSEGSADYLAVSYRRTLSLFQLNKIGPWVGNDEDGCFNGRFLSNTLLYPSSWTGENYGILWASTMMDIQNYADMGRDITTKLLLKSFGYANSQTIVPDHVYYVLLADQNLYSGTHLSSLGRGFENRGFFNGRTGSVSHPSNYINGNIISSTSWNGIKWVNATTYIKNSVTVTSYGFLFLGDFKKIIIESGGALYIQGTLIKYPGADIIVQPGGTLGFSKMSLNPESNESETPTEYRLLGNYPNPFNPSTIIKYSLPEASSVELRIYDVLGSEVKSFIINSQMAGNHEIRWDGNNNFGVLLSSGVYIYRIIFKSTNSFTRVEKAGKMSIIK